MTLAYCKKTCPECPWRKDVPVGKFPPKRFVALAETAYDLSGRVFACHLSPEGKEFACAGFVLQAHHNMALRLNRVDSRTVEATGPLFETYRDMAVANGVRRSHPALKNTR